MKRISFLLAFTISFITAFSQHPVGVDSFRIQTMGNTDALVKSKAAIGSDSGFINATYPDTTSANRGKIKNYPGAQIRVDDSIWVRNATATRWVNMMREGTSSSSLLLQTNGVDNGSQTLLNLQQGTNIMLTDNGSGQVTVNGVAFDTSTLHGVYMDTAFAIDDSTTRYCKGGTCWDITIHSSGITADTNFIRNQYTYKETKNSIYDTAQLLRIRLLGQNSVIIPGTGDAMIKIKATQPSSGSAFPMTSTALANARIEFNSDFAGGSGTGAGINFAMFDTSNRRIWQINPVYLSNFAGAAILGNTFIPNISTHPSMTYADADITNRAGSIVYDFTTSGTSLFNDSTVDMPNLPTYLSGSKDIVVRNSTNNRLELCASCGGSPTVSLNDSHIFVGNASNVATDVVMSGDATIDNTGAVTVDWTNGYPTYDLRYLQSIPDGSPTFFTVLDSTCSIPGSPATDDAYMVCGSPSGAWAGHALDIATWNGASWDFTDAVAGDYANTTDDFRSYIFRSGTWVRISGIPVLVGGNKLNANLTAGTNDNFGFELKTNNLTRLRISNAGTFTFVPLTGASSAVAVLSSTGLLSRSNVSTGFFKWNGSAFTWDNTTYLTTAVTSVAKGYGLVADGTITTTGTITVDSFAIASRPRLVKVADSLGVIIATKGTGTLTSVGVSSTDLSVSGSPITTSGSITLNINSNAVTDAKIRQSAGLSVIGRSANTTGNVADITGTADQVLRVSGTTLGFGTLANASLTNSSITYNGVSVALGASGTLTLASSNFANQGTTTTVLHGNASGNPSFAQIAIADLSATGTPSATTFLRGDNTWATPSASAALTATYVGYGDGSNVLTGSANMTYGSNTLSLFGTLGTELMPALTAGNWTVGTGWESPIVGPGLIKNANGVGTQTPSAATAIVAGTTYKVVITVINYTAGNFSYTLGVVQPFNSTINANGTYTEYITAVTTGNLIITPTNGARFTISAISVKAVSSASTTGLLTAEGNTTVGGNLNVLGRYAGIGMVNGSTAVNAFPGLSILGANSGVRMSHDNVYSSTFSTGATGALSLASNGGGTFTDQMFTVFSGGFGCGPGVGYNIYVLGGQGAANDGTTVFNGTTGIAYRMIQQANTATTVTANTNYVSVLLKTAAVTKSGTGTHPVFATLGLEGPAITNGASTLTAASTIIISTAASGTGAPTVANYGLWNLVRTRLDGSVIGGKGANVAAANDLTLGADGNTFIITGNTTVNAITTSGWLAGSHIYLIFSGTPTVKNNTAGSAGTAVFLLNGGVDFSATANDVLHVIFDGTSFVEAARSVN